MVRPPQRAEAGRIRSRADPPLGRAAQSSRVQRADAAGSSDAPVWVI